MNYIKEFITEKCKEQGIEQVIRSLGYSNIAKGKARLERILVLPDLGLSVPEYDNYFSSKGFVENLFSVLGNSDLINHDVIQEKLLDIEDERHGFHPWIFVETHFKRKNEPIFMLSCLEHVRRIGLPHAIKKLTREAQLIQLKECVLEFLKKLDRDGGCLPTWGIPEEFVCHLKENDILTLDLKGNLITEWHRPINHGGACLALR